MARVLGSYPIGRWFESYCRYHLRPVGQEVKTSPFHGGIMGSIPVRVTTPHSHKCLYIGVCGFLLFTGIAVVHCLSIIFECAMYLPEILGFGEYFLSHFFITFIFVFMEVKCFGYSVTYPRLCLLEHVAVDV